MERDRRPPLVSSQVAQLLGAVVERDRSPSPVSSQVAQLLEAVVERDQSPSPVSSQLDQLLESQVFYIGLNPLLLRLLLPLVCPLTFVLTRGERAAIPAVWVARLASVW